MYGKACVVARLSLMASLLLASGGCDIKSERGRGGRSDPEKLALLTNTGAAKNVNAALNPAEVVAAVDEYLVANTSSFPRGSASLYGVHTYDVDKDHLFYKLADTYDNALAAIFWSEHAKPYNAQRILNSFIRLMGLHGYQPLASGGERIANFQGLAARYTFRGGPHIHPATQPTDSSQIDTGNNAYMGMALCKFYQKYKDAFADHQGQAYRQASYDLLAFLHGKRLCPDRIGLRGRSALTNDDQWVSIEHNADVYALSQCLKSAFDPGAPEQALIGETLAASAAFVNKMFDEATGLYRIGTGACGGSADTAGAVPVDAQTWRYLAGAESGDFPQRTESSLQAVLEDRFFTMDTGDLPNGCEVAPIAGVDDTSLCTTLRDDHVLYGVRFTDRGFGIQLENTGSAYMALAHYQKATGATIKSERLELMRASMVSLLLQTRGKGVPASLRTHSLVKADGKANTTLFNTGLGWDYFRVPHTASTVWVGLALSYRPAIGVEADDGFNPYAATSSRVGYTASEPLKAIKLETVESLSCQALAQAPALPQGGGEACRVGNESLGAYCETICSAPATWFEAALDQDAFLQGLGVKRNNLCVMCGQHTDLISCSNERLRDLLAYTWKSYAHNCVVARQK